MNLNFLLHLFQLPHNGETVVNKGVDTFREIFLHRELFRIGNTPIYPVSFAIFLISVFFVFTLAGFFKKFVVRRLTARTNFGAGSTQLVGSILQYLTVFIGFVITLQIVGIELTSLSVIAGAVGVGVGFGLQNIASNFISGLIIVFERPFQIGDRIEIGNLRGKVIEIGGRSTRLLNDDETILIIPNQKLISDPVRNFRRHSEHIPQELKIYVGYGNDAQKALNIMSEVAEKNALVLKDPKPEARFKAFDAGKLDFVLNIWYPRGTTNLDGLVSDLNVAIYQEFLRQGITTRSPIDANISVTQPIDINSPTEN